ncbi:MAG: prepilin peptidase [Bacillota bacterium]
MNRKSNGRGGDNLEWSITFLFSTWCALSDAKTGEIPNVVVIPACLFGLIYHILLAGKDGLQYILASALVLVLFGFLAVPGWLGMGDVKLLAAIAAWVGLWPTITSFVVACLVSGIAAISHILNKKAQYIRFGPFLGVGVYISGLLHSVTPHFAPGFLT